jgi:hypothetical protein
MFTIRAKHGTAPLTIPVNGSTELYISILHRHQDFPKCAKPLCALIRPVSKHLSSTQTNLLRTQEVKNVDIVKAAIALD